MSKPRKDQEWWDLYSYIEKDILNYPDDMKLGKNEVLRLRGLSEGKLIANNNIRQCANYGTEVIKTAFSISKLEIQRVLNNKTFESEHHKFAYIMRIVEGKLNDVAIGLKQVKKAEETMLQVDTDAIMHKGMTYQEKLEMNKNENDIKSKSKLNKLLEDIL